MKKSNSKRGQETPQDELKRLRKENAKLKKQQEATKAKMDATKSKMDKMRKELKKKEEPKPVFSKEQWKRISTLLKDINTRYR